MIKLAKDNHTAMLPMTCGSCIHHTSIPLYEDMVCEKHGVLHYASAPAKCYTPDYVHLSNQLDSTVLKGMAKQVRGLTDTQVQALSYLLANAVSTRNESKFQFGQPV